MDFNFVSPFFLHLVYQCASVNVPFNTNEKIEFYNDFGSLEQDRKMSLLGRNADQRTSVKGEDSGWCGVHLLAQGQDEFKASLLCRESSCSRIARDMQRNQL